MQTGDSEMIEPAEHVLSVYRSSVAILECATWPFEDPAPARTSSVEAQQNSTEFCWDSFGRRSSPHQPRPLKPKCKNNIKGPCLRPGCFWICGFTWLLNIGGKNETGRGGSRSDSGCNRTGVRRASRWLFHKLMRARTGSGF